MNKTQKTVTVISRDVIALTGVILYTILSSNGVDKYFATVKDASVFCECRGFQQYHYCYHSAYIVGAENMESCDAHFQQIAAEVGITDQQVREIAIIAAFANTEKADAKAQHQAELDAAKVRPNYGVIEQAVAVIEECENAMLDEFYSERGAVLQATREASEAELAAIDAETQAHIEAELSASRTAQERWLAYTSYDMSLGYL